MNKTLEEIVRETKNDARLVQAVLDGIEKGPLHELISLITGEHIGSAAVDVTRMNLIGSLRASGYTVTGGRKGGKVYQIVDWAPPSSTLAPSADTWTGHARHVLDSVGTWFGPTMTTVREQLGGRETRTPLHEHCWMYLDTYEHTPRDEMYWIPNQPAIVFQRFQSRPRFRIFQIDSTPQALYRAAKYFAPASTTKVKIVGLTEDECKELRQLDPKGFYGKRPQAMYKTSDIGQHHERFLSSTERTQFRKLERITTFGLIRPRTHVDELTWLIDEWRRVNEKKHRQLAITRDYLALQQAPDDALIFVARRNGLPVGFRVMDQHASWQNVKCELVEKALNYKEMREGHSGTTDFTLVMACRWLAENGIEYINGGGFEGGGYGLAPHKAKFADKTFEPAAWEFTPNLPCRKDEEDNVR